MAVVEVINKKSCRDKVLMKLLRRSVLVSLRFNIHFRAKHIPGKMYVTADRLSRFNSAKRLLQASLAPATRKAYLHSWHIFLEWVGSISLPVHYITICSFIGHLFEIGYSTSSIASHISALTYIHKMLKLPDPAQCFLVRKLLRGCYKIRSIGRYPSSNYR